MSAEKSRGSSRSQQNSPVSSGICSSGISSSSSSLSSSSSQLSRQASDPSIDQSFSSSPSGRESSGSFSLPSHHRRHSSQDSASIIPQPSEQVTLISDADIQTSVVIDSASPTFNSTDLPELMNSPTILPPSSRPLILQHPSHGPDTSVQSDDGGNTSYINWLYDFYPNVLSCPKDKLEDFSQDPQHTESKLMEFSQDQSPNTIFRAQEKYVVTLGAPISIAQRMGEDTLTYLNKGQFYCVYIKANTNSTVPDRVRSVVSLNFFDEPDKRLEFNHWQYWYNLQANPNQKAFDIDRKNCENVEGKPENLAYNATACVWRPEVGVKIVLRINCLSTEFSSQKGVKGIPLHLVVDTYEDVENENAEPAHRAYCRVKIFRDKGAERKNKDETKSMERRMQKFMKQQPGVVGLDAELGPSSVFHPPSKETVLTSTSTFGPKTFLFIPQQLWSLSGTFRDKTIPADGEGGDVPPTFGVNKPEASSLLQSIRERETKRNFGKTFTQTKEDLDHLEVGAPPKKPAIVPSRPLITIYVRKEEEKVYNALLLDCLTVHDFKLQIAKKYDVPADMIKCVYKRTKKGFLVHFDDEMIARFEDEDDFIIELKFDNQKGWFDLLLCY